MAKDNKKKLEDPKKAEVRAEWQKLNAKAQAQIDDKQKQLLVARKAGAEVARQLAEEKAGLRKKLNSTSRELSATEAKYEQARVWVDAAILRVKDAGSTERRVVVDWGGGFLGSVVFQAMSLAARRGLGPKEGESAEGWFAKNANWIYDAILSAMAMGGYATELLTRPAHSRDKQGNVIKEVRQDAQGNVTEIALPYMPSELREIGSELSKVVGLSAFNRALSVAIDYWFSKDPKVLAKQF